MAGAEPIKIAIVGTGNIARSHARAITAGSAATLVAAGCSGGSGATDKGRYEDEAKVRTHATFLWRLRRGKESPNEYVKEVERQSSPSYGEENRDDWFVPWKPR